MASTASALVAAGKYDEVLATDEARLEIERFAGRILKREERECEKEERKEGEPIHALAAFNAFLQANVTGPPLGHRIEAPFAAAASNLGFSLSDLRRVALKSLEADGVAPYPYIPHVELFCLARDLVERLPVHDVHLLLRVRVWHYKLLSQPHLGPGAVFTKSSQWNDVPSVEELVEESLAAVETAVMGGRSRPSQSSSSTADRVSFLVEKACACILLGYDTKARASLAQAAELNGFEYALSGALGKRTRFQEKSTSQLVVLARSTETDPASSLSSRPHALPLHDDTLLEQIEFSDQSDTLPLSPLDQAILLAEATLRDAFSPADSLTAEEVLPFATRVVADPSTNWQVYTQALLTRSRIEVHRSRTVERGVLQMQAVVDQVVARTSDSSVPAIRVDSPDQPTSFLPASTDAAPAHVRLEYVHALAAAPRWHLESELAYAWVGVGSLASALEIFKRLRLWAEVALCLAGAARDDGGEEKGRAVLRWQLFGRADGEPDDTTDLPNDLRASDYTGPERNPPPANAPRLLCILGDVEEEPAHYERAWEMSGRRFARAQRSLGEYHLRKHDWPRARDAFRAATGAHRTNPDLWNRLGDVSLRLGAFDDAAAAFSRAIASADDAGGDARTWSNLGSALYSLYLERVGEGKEGDKEGEGGDDHDSDSHDNTDLQPRKTPASLLSQSLAAFQRGAAIAADNWRIWDNVITLAARVRPPAVSDAVVALRHVVRIRRSEDALDPAVLRLLLREGVLEGDPPHPVSPGEDGQEEVPYYHVLPRGSTGRAVCALLETAVVPLITARSELWELVARARGFCGDHAGAVDASERAWRAAVGSETKSWQEEGDASAWEAVVERTEELVSALENYGPAAGVRWQGKARSALRSVMGRARGGVWEGSDGWGRLQGLLEGVGRQRE